MSIRSRCCVCLVSYGTQDPDATKETRCARYTALQCGAIVCETCVPRMKTCHVHRVTDCFDHVFKIGMNTLDSRGKSIPIPMNMCNICMGENKKMVVFCDQDYLIHNNRKPTDYSDSDDSGDEEYDQDTYQHKVTIDNLQYKSNLCCQDCFDACFRDVAVSHAKLINM